MAGTAAARNLHCITQKLKNCEIITERLRGESVATSNALASPPRLCCALLRQQQGWQRWLFPPAWTNSSPPPFWGLMFCLILYIPAPVKLSELENNQTKAKKYHPYFLDPTHKLTGVILQHQARRWDSRRQISVCEGMAPSIDSFSLELFIKPAQHRGQLCDIPGVLNIIDLFWQMSNVTHLLPLIIPFLIQVNKG